MRTNNTITKLVAMLLAATGLQLLAVAPANNNFANAEVLPSNNSFTVNGTNVDATIEGGDPDFGGLIENESVWYSWTAPQSGKVALSASAPTGQNAKWGAVYVGNALLSGKYIRMGELTNGTLPFFAVAGQNYKICVFQYGFTESTFQLGLGYSASIPAASAFVQPLSNDDFASSYTVNPGGQDMVMSLREATFEPFESAMYSSLNISHSLSKSGSVWASWTAPANGKATITASSPNNDNDVFMVVGTGDSIATLNVLGGARRGGYFNCTAGVTYRLAFLSQDDSQLLINVSSSTGGGSSSNLFTGQAGEYTAFVGVDGWCTLTLAKSGSFSGKLVRNGVTYPLRGKLNSTGDYTGSLGALAVSLDLDMAASTAVPGNIAIAGNVGGTAFTLRHSVYAAGFTGAATLTTLLDPTNSAASVPQGIGGGVLMVSSKGKVIYKGKLAEGSSFSMSGPMVGDGSGGRDFHAFSNKVHRNLGQLWGTVGFDYSSPASCAADLDWRKPSRPADRYYPTAFSTTLDMSGAAFTKTGRLPVVDFTTLADGLTFTAADGGLSVDLIEDTTYSGLNNKLTVSGANAQKVKLTLSSGSGKLSGTFVHSATGKIVKFSGYALQDPAGNRLAGYFLEPVSGLSGSARVED